MKIKFTYNDYKIMHNTFLNELADLKDIEENRRNIKVNFINYIAKIGSPAFKQVAETTNKKELDKFIQNFMDLMKENKEEECAIDFEELFSGFQNTSHKIFMNISRQFKDRFNLFILLENHILDSSKSLDKTGRMAHLYLIGVNYSYIDIHNEKTKEVFDKLIPKIQKINTKNKINYLCTNLSTMIKAPEIYSMEYKKEVFCNIVNANPEFIHTVREEYKSLYNHFKDEFFSDELINNILGNKSEVFSVPLEGKKYVISIQQLCRDNNIKVGVFLENFKLFNEYAKLKMQELSGDNSITTVINNKYANFIIHSDNMKVAFYSIFEKSLELITKKSIQNERIADIKAVWEQVALYEKLHTDAPNAEKKKSNKI